MLQDAAGGNPAWSFMEQCGPQLTEDLAVFFTEGSV